MEVDVTKTCQKCHTEKPLEEFHVQKTGKHGRLAYCKECKLLDQKIGAVSGWAGRAGALRLPKGVEL